MKIDGIDHQRTLRAQGVARAELLRRTAHGEHRTVRPWYVTDAAPTDLLALLELGLRPTCLDAASLHGVWTPPHTGVHVFRPRMLRLPPELEDVRELPLRRGRMNGTGKRPLQRLVLHGPELRSWPDDDPVPDLGLVLEHAARCLPTVKAAVLMESSLQRRLIGRGQLEQLLLRLPKDIRRPLSRVRGDAESGTETAVRWWFESRGIGVKTQVRFPYDARRVDLLVGRNWIIECDSREFHDDPLSYAEDRARDLYLESIGYRVTRLTWEQVFLHWPDTRRKLQTILSRGDHRRELRRSARSG
ncbi:hypothetical protein ACH0CV_00090 [Brachybacterium paraconglomeratum]|uniref:hypothetical protein n=1 Tax=Brachybacterium paraconglomeratum TaxID=173362 RepID=UPI003879F9BB